MVPPCRGCIARGQPPHCSAVQIHSGRDKLCLTFLWGGHLRFDDRLATILTFPHDDARARALLWRQMIDVLAQTPPELVDPLPVVLLDRLRVLQGQVPVSVRIEAVAACHGRLVHPAIVAIAANDVPVVARAALDKVKLDDADWMSLLPRLSVTARAALRQRADLSDGVRAALTCFGISDFALPAPPTCAITADGAAEPLPEVGEDPVVIDGDGSDTGPDTITYAIAADPVEATVDAGSPAASDGGSAADDRRDHIGPLPADPVEVDNPSNVFGEAGDPAMSIVDLLARIAAYRREGPAPPPPIETFRFETDAIGTIDGVEGAPRAALAGLSIAQARRFAADGVDESVADAFRRRASFRDARLMLSGSVLGAAPWLASGMPSFDPANGRFTGYRGTAHRQPVSETPPVAGLFGAGLTDDGLRQFVHELRTPLNAIIGFGEMVEGQVLGPAAARYRAQARTIVEQGRHLLNLIEDLDLTTRPDPSGTARAPVSPAIMLSRLWEEHRASAVSRDVVMSLHMTGEAEAVLIQAGDIERLFARLFAAVVVLCRTGEAFAASLSVSGAFLILSLTRPVALRDRTEADILAAGFAPDAIEADVLPLGLGFTLRLVRKLATAAGGVLEFQPHHLVLRLPAFTAHASGEVPR